MVTPFNYSSLQISTDYGTRLIQTIKNTSQTKIFSVTVRCSHAYGRGFQHAFDNELGLSVHQLKYMLTANKRYAVPCSLAANGITC